MTPAASSQESLAALSRRDLGELHRHDDVPTSLENGRCLVNGLDSRSAFNSEGMKVVVETSALSARDLPNACSYRTGRARELFAQALDGRGEPCAKLLTKVGKRARDGLSKIANDAVAKLSPARRKMRPTGREREPLDFPRNAKHGHGHEIHVEAFFGSHTLRGVRHFGQRMEEQVARPHNFIAQFAPHAVGHDQHRGAQDIVRGSLGYGCFGEAHGRELHNGNDQLGSVHREVVTSGATFLKCALRLACDAIDLGAGSGADFAFAPHGAQRRNYALAELPELSPARRIRALVRAA